MRRRDFLVGLGATAAWPLAARAQQSGKMPVVGVLLPLAEGDPEQLARRDGLRQQLAQLGWLDGRNVRIEYRYAGGVGRFAALAKEMIELQPDVIFVQSTGFVAAVQQQTRSIPVVFANVSDPIGSGFVASLARPGGNLTGLLLFEGQIAGKWLAMLKEVAPRVRRVAFIIDPRTTPFDYFFPPSETAAKSLAVELVPSRVENAGEIERALDGVAREPDSGFIVAPGATVLRNRGLLISLAARHGLPGVYPERVYAIDGGLASYGTADLIEPFRRAAFYIDRILRGEKPADLPVQAPTRYSTVVNVRTAKALGLTVPPSLMLAADEVIE